MFAAFFHPLNKLDHVARAGRAVAAEAAVCTRLRIDLQTRGLVGVEGAQQPVVPVRF